MSEFFTALGEHAFLRYALLAGLLASVASGVVGTYVVVRRITYIAGGIAHCVLGGLGAARYLQVVHGQEWATPSLGAFTAAILAAAVIGLVGLKARQREDTVIGATWAIGLALGVLFISRTPGYNQDLMSYLFGNVLLTRPADLWMMACLDLVVAGTALALYKHFLALCFDEEFARLRGVRTDLLYLLLLGLTAVTVVLLVRVVGIALVIALLTLPVAIAGRFSRSLAQMMVLAVFVGAALTSSGLALSYAPNLPTGATTIVLAGLAYFGLLLVPRRGPRRAQRRRSDAAAAQGSPRD